MLGGSSILINRLQAVNGSGVKCATDPQHLFSADYFRFHADGRTGTKHVANLWSAIILYTITFFGHDVQRLIRAVFSTSLLGSESEYQGCNF